MVSRNVKINLSALKYEIKTTAYHKNHLVTQLEALANFHGLKNQLEYPAFEQTINVILDFVGVGTNPGSRAYSKLLQTDLAACKEKKGQALVTSGAPVTFLAHYGSMKGICFLFLERGSTRSAFTIVESMGDTDYFCSWLGPKRLEQGCPVICPLLVQNNRQIYELLEVKEESQNQFIQLITSALTPDGNKPVVADHVFVPADETLVEMMPAVEEAIKNSLRLERTKWYPVK
jgi:hypothetical protein